jgi:hypothetical protein
MVTTLHRLDVLDVLIDTLSVSSLWISTHRHMSSLAISLWTVLDTAIELNVKQCNLLMATFNSNCTPTLPSKMYLQGVAFTKIFETYFAEGRGTRVVCLGGKSVSLGGDVLDESRCLQHQ